VGSFNIVRPLGIDASYHLKVR